MSSEIDIKYVADLARLELSAEQAEKLLNEMFSLTELAKNDIALLHEHAS